MYTMTDPDTVYDAKVMPEDSSEPVYASRLGETPQAAKDAVLDASERKVPPATLLDILLRLKTQESRAVGVSGSQP